MRCVLWRRDEMMILLDECSMLKLILNLFDDDFFCSWKFTKLKCSRVGGEKKRGRRKKEIEEKEGEGKRKIQIRRRSG